MATNAQFDENLWDESLFDQNDTTPPVPTAPSSKRYGCKVVVAPKYLCRVSIEEVR